MVKKYKTIIGVDPGASGGIVTKHKGSIQVFKTKKGNQEIAKLLEKMIDGETVLFLEKVTMNPTDTETCGKFFGIQKMMKQYENFKVLVEMCGIDMVEVHPKTWQSHFGFKAKGMDKTQRKNLYKKHAQHLFPGINVTLWNADALLIYAFGIRQLQGNPDWVQERLKVNKGW